MIYHLQQGNVEINTIIFDLNGTLSEYGLITQETEEWIFYLKQMNFQLILLTSDQRGNAKHIAEKLQIDYHIAKTGKEKKNFVIRQKLPFFAIGNARNDIPMFEEAFLSFVPLQTEGIHTDILNFADIVVPTISDAFKLISDEQGLISTMKQ